jgi:hypothetical protein
MAVGGGDVRMAVQPQDADGQTFQRRHYAGRVFGPDQGLVLLVGDVAQWSLFSMCQGRRTQAARVSGLALRSLVIRQTTSTVFLPSS